MNHVRLALLTSCALAVAACSDEAADRPTTDTFTVSRGPMPITIKENAELKSVRETAVRSGVEGQATIIWIIPEGSSVKAGDKLVELDASELIDKQANQKISVSKADAALAQAAKNLEILDKELTANRTTAESNLLIAQMELEKFLGRESKGDSRNDEGRNRDMLEGLIRLTSEAVAPPAEQEGPPDGDQPEARITQVNPKNFAPLVGKVRELLSHEGKSTVDRDMGDMANRILEQVDTIRLAMADLKVKEDKFGHSRRLAAKNFITRQELEGDQLNYHSQMSKVRLAWNNLDLLINYDLAKERIKLAQDVNNAALELERVNASNMAERTRAESDHTAKSEEYKLAKERLDNLDRQITNATIFAPNPGLVVYARMDRDRRSSESVREGVTVRERQELIILPDTTKMMADVKVQESAIDQVQVGQIAGIRVEAFPDRNFVGRVTRVAPVADSNSGWMTSDRKQYTTIVELDGDNADQALRSRMAAAVTIYVAEIPDTIAVPIQAVRRDRSVNYVWKHTAAGPEAVVVEVGRYNQEQTQILKGVEAGERIYLATPRGMQEPQFPQPMVPASLPTAPPDNPTAQNGNGAIGTNGNGNNGGERRGPGTGQPGRGRMTTKPFAEMTPEELEEFKTTRLSMYEGMLDRAGENVDPNDVAEFRKQLDALKQGLTANDLAAAQTAADALRGSMRKLMGGGRGTQGNGGRGQSPGGRGNGEGAPEGRRGGGN